MMNQKTGIRGFYHSLVLEYISPGNSRQRPPRQINYLAKEKAGIVGCCGLCCFMLALLGLNKWNAVFKLSLHEV